MKKAGNSEELTFLPINFKFMYKKIIEIIHISQSLMEICITRTESEDSRSSKLTYKCRRKGQNSPPIRAIYT